jgi:hypothetical protein
VKKADSLRKDDRLRNILNFNHITLFKSAFLN